MYFQLILSDGEWHDRKSKRQKEQFKLIEFIQIEDGTKMLCEIFANEK